MRGGFKHDRATAATSRAGFDVQSCGADRRASSPISEMVKAVAIAAPANKKAPVALEGEDDV